MSSLWPIVAMAAGVYALRLAGLLLPRRAVPPGAQQALRFLPVALLGALVVATLSGRSYDPTAWVAVVGAGLVGWATRRMWACILSGIAIFWLLRLI